MRGWRADLGGNDDRGGGGGGGEEGRGKDEGGLLALREARAGGVRCVTTASQMARSPDWVGQ